MINKAVLLKSLRSGGRINDAADIVADKIRRSTKEERREFVYEYRRLNDLYESYDESSDIDENDAEYMDCMKRVLIYRLAFRKLGVDSERVLGKK